jgi:hypothetical protein
LANVPKGATIVVCEGEKARNALAEKGIHAVGTVTGAASVPDLDAWRVLEGHDVVLWPDEDGPGYEHMGKVAVKLRQLGLEPRSMVWTAAPEHGDAFDWFAAGRTVDELRDILAAAPPWSLAPGGNQDVTVEEEQLDHESGVSFTSAADITPEAVTWTWEGRMPAGMVTLLVGMPGLGKSTLALDLAARLTRGQLAGVFQGQPVNVAVASMEDSIASVVVPRLMAAGADLTRVQLVAVHMDGTTGVLSLPDHLAGLRAKCQAFGIRYLVVDPLVSSLSASTNSWKDADVRRVLAPLAQLADELGLAVVGTMHVNKNAGQAEVLDRIGGSRAFGAAARSVLLYARDVDDEAGDDGVLRILAHAKCNVGALAPALRFRMEGTTIDTKDKKKVETGHLAWLGTADGITAGELLHHRDDEEKDDEDRARDLITSWLSDGPKDSKVMQAELKAQRIPERAWKRAKRKLGVTSKKRGLHDGWAWELPTTKKSEEGQSAPISPECSSTKKDTLSIRPSSREMTKKDEDVEEYGLVPLEEGQNEEMYAFGQSRPTSTVPPSPSTNGSGPPRHRVEEEPPSRAKVIQLAVEAFGAEVQARRRGSG